MYVEYIKSYTNPIIQKPYTTPIQKTLRKPYPKHKYDVYIGPGLGPGPGRGPWPGPGPGPGLGTGPGTGSGLGLGLGTDLGPGLVPGLGPAQASFFEICVQTSFSRYNSYAIVLSYSETTLPAAS